MWPIHSFHSTDFTFFELRGSKHLYTVQINSSIGDLVKGFQKSIFAFLLYFGFEKTIGNCDSAHFNGSPFPNYIFFPKNAFLERKLVKTQEAMWPIQSFHYTNFTFWAYSTIGGFVKGIQKSIFALFWIEKAFGGCNSAHFSISPLSNYFFFKSEKIQGFVITWLPPPPFCYPSNFIGLVILCIFRLL